MERNESHNTKSSLVATNKMTTRELMEKENALIVFHEIEGKDKKKHTCFTCGSITGYVSPNAVKESKSNLNYLDNLVYADVSKDGGSPIPCLMIKPRKVFSNSEERGKIGITEKSKEEKQQNLNLAFSDVMPAKELVIKQNALLKYYDYDDIDGEHHTYFTCGKAYGYLSPNAKQEITKKDSKLDDFVYIKVSKQGYDPVPYLTWKSEGPTDLELFFESELTNDLNTEHIIRARIKEEFEVGITEAKQKAIENKLKPPFDSLVIKRRIRDIYNYIKYDKDVESKCKKIGIDFSYTLNILFIKYYIFYSTSGINEGNFDFKTIEGTVTYGEYANNDDIDSETRNKVFFLLLGMLHFKYGNIQVTKENIDNPTILTLPLIDICISCEESDNIKNMCKNKGWNHLELIIEAAQHIIKHFVVKEEPTYDDLFF